MTKQEKIREGIAKYIRLHYDAPIASSEITSDVILRYLDENGVVIKKEFVPPYLPNATEREKQTLAIVEPLIKEV